MDLIPDTQNYGLCMRQECRERFSRHRLQRKPLVSDNSMHHGTCATHVPWCMSGSLTRCGGKTSPENVPGIPGACATRNYCPACRTSLIATRFWVVVICPIIKCLTVLEFSFILFDLCLFITIFNFILNYVPIVTFWIFTYHKIWILLIIFCFIWNYWNIYFLTCLEVFWSVVG